jgi:hypothetical protein
MTSPAGAVPNHPPVRRFRLALPLIGAGVIVVAALWAFIAFLRPLPPRTVTIATGPEGGAYHEVGKRYRELLAHQGITVQLLSTAGARENLARLRDAGSRVDVAFLQGGHTACAHRPRPRTTHDGGADVHRGVICSRGHPAGSEPEGRMPARRAAEPPPDRAIPAA